MMAVPRVEGRERALSVHLAMSGDELSLWLVMSGPLVGCRPDIESLRDSAPSPHSRHHMLQRVLPPHSQDIAS